MAKRMAEAIRRFKEIEEKNLIGGGIKHIDSSQHVTIGNLYFAGGHRAIDMQRNHRIKQTRVLLSLGDCLGDE